MKVKLFLITFIAAVFIVLPAPILAAEFPFGKRLFPANTTTPIVDVLNRAKSMIMARYDAVIDRLGLIKGRLSQNRMLDTAEINELDNKIDSEIDFFEKKKGEIQQAQNREEIVRIISETKQQQVNVRQEARSTAGKIIIGKINPILDKLNNARNRIQEAVNGANISTDKKNRVTALLTDHDKNIALAKDKSNQAKGKFDSNLSAEGMQLIKDARLDLKTAQANLKQAIAELKKK